MTDAITEHASWRNAALPATERADALIAQMTLREKTAQLFGIWVGASAEGGEVAPYQHDMTAVVDLDEILPHGLGQLTRPFGTLPVDAGTGALSLMRSQQRIAASNRFGIPALAHEECLAGFAAWGATAYPVPLAWGATFNPDLIRTMAAAIGADMRSVGIHQGLAPVLDVVRDARWGRVEETIGEDPYLVGTIGTAYIQGLEGAGIVATLKHFAGYSASRAGRNLAPVSIGPREFADVVLAPFEMAVRESGVRSVMHAYTDTDGIPSAADAELLTGLLRETWGFTGTVVADYFGIAFLKELHRIAGTLGEAGSAALSAGVDVELPTVNAFGGHLLREVESGRLDIAVIDRALRRVLIQKIGLGLLDPDWSPVPAALAGTLNDDDGGDGGVTAVADAVRGSITLDPPENRRLAAEVAEQSIILTANNGILPLAAPQRIALIGPNADNPMAFLGCYSFPAHVGSQHPGTPTGIDLPTVAESVRTEFPQSTVTVVQGCSIDGTDTGGFDEARAAAAAADVVIAVLGDRAGLFGRGTSGEGCDVESLVLPGVQQQLLDALLDTGTPVVLTLLTGRPYALGGAPGRAAAVVHSFFPGEEGGPALAGVLSGRINPSGRLPVSVPASPGAQPATYLSAPLGRMTEVSSIDPTPAYAFGHGLGYTSFEFSDLVLDGPAKVPVDGETGISLTVTNTGGRDGAEIVQLYLHDPVASVVRPVQRLIGYARVPLAAGASARVSVTVPADIASFTGARGNRIVEPGMLELQIGCSSTDIRLRREVELTGSTRTVDHTRRLHCDFHVRDLQVREVPVRGFQVGKITGTG
ncbi:glycoside hydrolase family 3 C-terminal domain-containing protein [Arthrobacter jiangjiafuii]|uniref:Glycoside hydrolase family 3 C-terminal domain-containing protein n=1 Tax=Arthrobacter jiangjiafuii TaxID=2817475 RepID=A0A975M6D1_9MICC|nr:glycoside hydrolase family 3 N-terminal domain-containing protein [Arthrobacter jiangjiafuii]MBP3043736.1 glycoside hydrolase family 3 C-terminal domain-containing protein [Arthrobacter jiangjiafuii]QWC10765.1 glycoside hydrolase family 3 C-terminal domain-containing protein [Arthrobacter jiangjiafuii]